MVALREHKEPLPAAAVLFSPWVDCSDGHGHVFERGSFTSNAAIDYIPAHLSHMLADAWAGGRDLKHPWVSPLHCDLAGLPPLLIQAGDGEVLRDQILEFAELAAAAGVSVKLELAPEMVHVFQLFAFVGDDVITHGST